jgi:hypothetical protein
MGADERNLLDLLRAELNFLEQGGYAQRQESNWRAPFIFEDSPTCLNFHRSGPRQPCTECALIRLVPPESRKAEVPCRHIPLNVMGETIEGFYRTATQQELEWALDKWLRRKIKQLEEKKI